MARQGFDKNSFLNQGAVFGYEDRFNLFWGEVTYSSERPNQNSLAVMDYFSDTIKWKTYSRHMIMDRAEFRSHFNEKKKLWKWESSGKKLFGEMFQDTKKAIAKRELEKLVPYTMDWNPLEEKSFFLESSIANSLQFIQGFLYGDWNNLGGVLGLTPEILIKEESGVLETMALAGTCDKSRFGKNPSSFTDDPKELKEHQKVVDEISFQLENLGDLTVGAREVLETPSLVHLKTSMKLENFNENVEDIVLKLHPTPALGSFPQKKGESYLKHWNEKLPRGVFGAPFGMSKNSKESLFLVAIRNLIWDAKTIKILCGCGVVEESDLEKEWQELENKKNSVKKIFGVL